MAKDYEDEAETPSPGQELGVAVPGRTISTLHLLSIFQNLGQDFAKSCNGCFLGFLFNVTPASAISAFPGQHDFDLPTFHSFLLSSLLTEREDLPPQPYVARVKPAGILHITGRYSALPIFAGLELDPAGAALPTLMPVEQPFIPRSKPV